MAKRNVFILGVLLLGARAFAVPAAKRTTPAVQKLQSLAGDWMGKDERGNRVETSFKSIAGQTAVVESLALSGMEDMVTIYSQDGDAIVLLHYCPTNNQPRMRATPPPGDVKELNFAFEGAGNLADPNEGHQHQLIIQFHDKDHITERWTWRQDGKDTEMVCHFNRKKP